MLCGNHKEKIVKCKLYFMLFIWIAVLKALKTNLLEVSYTATTIDSFDVKRPLHIYETPNCYLIVFRGFALP